jgi:membrane protein CcdC involved in cytochrome C biogenesis
MDHPVPFRHRFVARVFKISHRMPGSPATGALAAPFMMARGWLFFLITGYRAALAAMDPMVESMVMSMVASYMGKR